MGSHAKFGPICVFSFTLLCVPAPRAMFRCCFARVSRPLRRYDRRSCYTTGVILDRADLARVLGTEIPPSVEGVAGVTHDSRRVEPGFAFVAIPGFKHDGVGFAPEALRRGAALVVAEREVPGAPTAVVPDARASLAALARGVFGDPSRSMEVYGVTGTNGKTTTSYALYSILAAAYGEQACGLMSTAETISAGERRPAVRTTPEATEVQRTLAGMLEEGVRRVVMEVS